MQEKSGEQHDSSLVNQRGRPQMLGEERESKVANRAFKKGVIRQFKVTLNQVELIIITLKSCLSVLSLT